MGLSSLTISECLSVSSAPQSITTTNSLSPQHGNSLKENAPFQTQSQALQADVFFLFVGAFLMSAGAHQLSFSQPSAKERWRSGILLSHTGKTSDLDPFLICSHPQAEVTRSHSPTSSSLCYCFLCIETPVCYSLSPCLSSQRVGFLLCLPPNTRLLWRSLT